jgi:poly-gamma-glutamate synthesis protein (capsule biosynthesis protein)
VKAADVRAIASGDGTFKALVLVDEDADAILAALDLDRDALGERLVTVKNAPALARNLAKNRTRLGFLRADEVGESVRALAWGSRSLFGVDRVERLADWRLTARLPVPEGSGPGYDPADAWTIVAGGDILMDRGVALAIKDKGVNFPFDGGTVDITGTCKDCSPFGWDTPYTKRTGNKGVIRSLIGDADLAIANFENPAPDNYSFHGKGTVFTANPAYIKGLRKAGIDWVSLANNHIGDAGRKGMLQTMTNLDEYGIAHSGLGKNQKAAHKAALMDVGDVTVGILGYDTVASYYRAGASTPGSAWMTAKALKRDVKAARKAGADVVIVFPHWGVEYRATPSATQRSLGKAAIDAGADMVIGNHAHWAAAMEVYDGKPIWYALGNFVFDQTWSIPTMEGITLELTFDGTDLVQARMRPHLILDRAQPNLLDPLGDGKAVLNQVFRASKGLLPW